MFTLYRTGGCTCAVTKTMPIHTGQVFCSHIKALNSERFLYQSEGAPRRSRKRSITYCLNIYNYIIFMLVLLLQYGRSWLVLYLKRYQFVLKNTFDQGYVYTITGSGGNHPDPEISGGRPVSETIFFSALRVSVWSKNKGGPRVPRAPPLDPPLNHRTGRYTCACAKTIPIHTGKREWAKRANPCAPW